MKTETVIDLTKISTAVLVAMYYFLPLDFATPNEPNKNYDCPEHIREAVGDELFRRGLMTPNEVAVQQLLSITTHTDRKKAEEVCSYLDPEKLDDDTLDTLHMSFFDREECDRPMVNFCDFLSVDQDGTHLDANGNRIVL